MPTYEYQCDACGYTFEEFQKITDDPLTECPQCKGELKKLIGSGCGLIFKGKGFYITDYKKKDQSAAEKKDSPKNEPKKDSAAPEPKKDTKQDTKNP